MPNSASTQTWQDALANLVTDPIALLKQLNLDDELQQPALNAAKLFPLRTTQSFVSRMVIGDPKDPLLKQVLPIFDEHTSPQNYSVDPLQEERANVAPGLIHKYAGRVLLITAPQCAINCRYCFRRHFDYTSNSPSRQEWLAAFQYIQADATIEEVILSGGEPLVLADKQLQWLVTQIEQIPHVTRLRIHTRLPIVLPQRITPELLQTFETSRLHCCVVVHCNHPQEIDPHVSSALQNLRNAGITTLNQSVLLKDINDCSDVLADLSKKLFQHGTLPYYLHLLDRVHGTSHFEVHANTAQNIYRQLHATLPGYLVPKLVRECPDHPYKVPIALETNANQASRIPANKP